LSVGVGNTSNFEVDILSNQTERKRKIWEAVRVVITTA